MSLEKIHLRKLLQIFYHSDSGRRKILKGDARASVIKEAKIDDDDGGGDFHSPFWADAKDHVRGLIDLQSQTKVRIGDNSRRGRLYPRLSRGFLEWWNEKRRWRNEDFEFIPERVNARLPVGELGGIVKVENLLALKIGDHTSRIVYPYFAEDPTLSPEAARIGLWVMSQALPNYKQDDLRILDVLRSTSYAVADVPFIGNERDLFVKKYESALREWKKYRKEYRNR